MKSGDTTSVLFSEETIHLENPPSRSTLKLIQILAQVALLWQTRHPRQT